ncbi:hypothetical protein RchiOBHm_Chr1g0356061 [Rosa chinensis]|uniref:Uncharacterized protein n=1 Tax=Rosa chinensis TaxID=74649 RepID=A0A2P6SHM6_ROSCH|nr:hypothetical protein RchiOBHm_Chr1g0356061 [Rosa chinensis]
MFSLVTVPPGIFLPGDLLMVFDGMAFCLVLRFGCWILHGIWTVHWLQSSWCLCITQWISLWQC